MENGTTSHNQIETASPPTVERNAVFYEPGQCTAGRPSTAEEEGENFYQVTARDVMAMQKDLTEKMNRHLVLLPKNFVAEKDRELKLQAWKHTVVRFKLLDKWVLQAQFASEEKVGKMHEFIREILGRSDFELRLVRWKFGANDNRTFIEAEIAPKSMILVTFSEDIAPEELEPILESSPAKKCASEEEADKLFAEWLSVNSVFRPYLSSASAHFQEPAAKQNPEQPDDDYSPSPSLQRQKEGPPVPKWFKLK